MKLVAAKNPILKLHLFLSIGSAVLLLNCIALSRWRLTAPYLS